MISGVCLAIIFVVNASSCERSCLQFLISTWSGLGGKRVVLHILEGKMQLQGQHFSFVLLPHKGSFVFTKKIFFEIFMSGHSK